MNLHFIARELRKRGQVSFFSCRFSALSRFRDDDPRHGLSARANRVETHDGVRCFLWKTPLHPPTMPLSFVGVEALAFRVYSAVAPRVLRQWIAGSDVIIIESGIAVVFFELIKALNPSARVVYLASDGLETIGAAAYVQAYLERVHGRFDAVILTSPALKKDFPHAKRATVVPHGIDAAQFAQETASPFPPGSRNGVSVGSMLFDGGVFQHGAPLCPDVTFHVIGSGSVSSQVQVGNVIHYPEMRFAETIPYLQHADFGIAPYRAAEIPAYLADTSMKLIQFAQLGLPSVCPNEVVGRHPLRFGYDAGRIESFAAAVSAALEAPHVPVPAMNWDEVTTRIVEACGPLRR